MEGEEWIDESRGVQIFDIGLSGDNLFTYCLAADGTPHFIHGFTNADGGWAEFNQTTDEYRTERSALPEGLQGNGSIAVPYFQNYVFNGTSSLARKDEMILRFTNSSYYQGANEMRFDIANLNNETTSSSTTMFGTPLRAAVLCTAAFAIFPSLGFNGFFL